MASTKVTVHRQWWLPTWLARISPTAQQAKRIYPYKIKLTLPEQKQADIKKNGNVIKTINKRRKSKYFSDSSARLF